MRSVSPGCCQSSSFTHETLSCVRCHWHTPGSESRTPEVSAKGRGPAGAKHSSSLGMAPAQERLQEHLSHTSRHCQWSPEQAGCWLWCPQGGLQCAWHSSRELHLHSKLCDLAREQQSVCWTPETSLGARLPAAVAQQVCSCGERGFCTLLTAQSPSLASGF